MADFLYIHIPFCVRKCLYCDFLSLPFDEQAARRYLSGLCRELELKSSMAGELKTIFIGGGTPTLLPADCFEQLFHCLRKNFMFSPEIEISVEANPGTVTAPKLEVLFSLGVNRMSVGIQSFRDDELKMLGRIHTSDEALEAVNSVKSAGFKNWSVDLMYGIPGQTMEAWKETLAKALGLFPCHISAYELTPEEGTPLWRLIEENTVQMPDEGLVLDMYNYAIDSLRDRGFEHYEISNHALPGFRCLHNLNYWNRGEYLGTGAGAHSFIKGVRSRNTGDVNVYIEDLKNDLIPEAEAIIISPEEALKESIFLGLRKTEGIDLAQAKKMRADFPAACSELVCRGLLALSENSIRLTRKGLPVSNMVIVRLFERLGL
jgi:oxygen-independent coproporphyrinogen III oxidase